MPRYSYVPQADVGFKTAQTGLAGWLDRQKRSREQFTAAEAPLRKAVTSFQPGGGYGRGQKMLLRDQARQAGAEATARQVASGMSSGSLATGTGLRIKRDLATAEAGVEDQRTRFLNEALANLSGLRGSQASITAQTADPTLAPMLGYLSSRFGQVAGMNQTAMGVGARRASPASPNVSLGGRKPQFALPGFVY
jgi:hypothetical protein